MKRFYYLLSQYCDLFLLVGECGTSGGEDEDHSKERTHSEVCGKSNFTHCSSACSYWFTTYSVLVHKLTQYCIYLF